MRILRVISSMDPAMGGPCQGIRNSIPALTELGQTHHVLSLDSPDAAFLGNDPFPVKAVGPSKTSWAYAAGLRPELERCLERYDAVIQHGLWQYPGYALLQAARRRSSRFPKWFIYPHGMLDPWFQRASSRRLKALRNYLYWRVIEKRVVNSADGLLFTCEEEMRLAVTTFAGYRPKATFNVGYGIPEPPGNVDEQLAAFHHAFPHLRDRAFLLFLSRIHPKKGVDLLLKAYAEVYRGRGSADALPPLVIAGPCSDAEYWNSLQSLAVGGGLQAKTVPYEAFTSGALPAAPTSSLVTWPGMLSGDIKWGALRSAGAFILPSHQENFGIAVVEALACGTPVLISNKVNIWREIEAGKAGWVEADTVEGTLHLISRFLSGGRADASALRPYACYQNSFGIKSAAENLCHHLHGPCLNRV